MSKPAAGNLVVKVPGAQHNQGVFVYDTPDETIVQFVAQKAGENIHLAWIRVTYCPHPCGQSTALEHCSTVLEQCTIKVTLTQFTHTPVKCK